MKILQEAEERHVLTVIVDNEAGILAKIAGLFTARGYNIDSLTVADITENHAVSRITIVTHGPPAQIDQIHAQLERLIPVHKVIDLTEVGPYVERELALVKVSGTGDARVEALRVAEIFRAKPVDTTTSSFIFELTGTPDKIDTFVGLMRELGLVEVRVGELDQVADRLRPPRGVPGHPPHGERRLLGERELGDAHLVVGEQAVAVLAQQAGDRGDAVRRPGPRQQSGAHPPVVGPDGRGVDDEDGVDLAAAVDRLQGGREVLRLGLVRQVDGLPGLQARGLERVDGQPGRPPGVGEHGDAGPRRERLAVEDVCREEHLGEVVDPHDAGLLQECGRGGVRRPVLGGGSA